MPIIQHLTYTNEKDETEWTSTLYDGTTYDEESHHMTIRHYGELTKIEMDPPLVALELLWQASAHTIGGDVSNVDQHVMVLRRLPPGAYFQFSQRITKNSGQVSLRERNS